MDKAYYDEMPHVVQPGKITFGADTYVGNWYEETVRNTLKRDDFLRRRECGDLSIQRTQTMVDMLLKPVELTPQTDLCLHYGDQIQIVSPGPSCATAKEVYPFKRNYCKLSHLALSSTVPPSQIDHSPYLSTDSIISASPLLFPVVRNSFIIEKPMMCSGDVGGVVMYGDVFRIRAFDTQYFPLYLFSAPAIRLHVGSTHSGRPKVRFSDLTTSDTLWCAHPLDAFELMKMELGVPIPLKKPLLLKHNGTGNCLSTEPDFPVLTYFGNEIEVTVDNKFDKGGYAKKPAFENVWYFDTDRGWPKTKDPADIAFEKQAELSAKINVNSANQPASYDDCSEENQNGQQNGDDEDGESEECCQAEQQGQGQASGGAGGYSAYQNPNYVQETENLLSQMSLRGNRDGLRPYDPQTAPQPNAHRYRVQEDERFPNFPNQKWNCGDTDCCNNSWKLPDLKPQPPCETCECVEPSPPGENINAPVPFKRLLM